MKNDIGCLVIHGFGGSVYEVEPLAQKLIDKGYSVICPTLKGHTGRRRDFEGVKYDDWISSAEEDLLKLASKCKKIYILGFSMGGLIAINLALKYDIEGLVTISMPIYYWDLKRVMLNLIDDFKRRDFQHFKRYIKSSGNVTLGAMINFKLLLDKTKLLVSKIKCPAFVVQANDDDTVRKHSANYIFENLSSKCKKINFYENGGHLILRSKAANEVISDIEKFLDEIKNI